MIAHIHKFRDKLDSGQLCLGTGISFTDPAVTESLCASVDFFWIDLEHSPIGLESLMAHLIAARAGGTPALVRVPSNEIAWVKRVLDIGAEGVILPRAKSAEEVRNFVSACRYPPMGTRSYGPRRPSNYGRNSGTEYREDANRNLFVTSQIETASALEEVEEIARIEGLDSLAIGPYDLSGEMGIMGEVRHPRVTGAIERIARVAREAGRYVGIGMGGDVDYATTAAELGVQWIQCGSDSEYSRRFAENLFARVRERVS